MSRHAIDWTKMYLVESQESLRWFPCFWDATADHYVGLNVDKCGNAYSLTLPGSCRAIEMDLPDVSELDDDHEHDHCGCHCDCGYVGYNR